MMTNLDVLIEEREEEVTSSGKSRTSKLKTFGQRSILLAMAALFSSGCGHLVIPIKKITNSPININPSRAILFHSQNVYKNVDQQELEKRLVEIAATANLEDAWIYNPKTRTLIDVGFYETLYRTHAYLNPKSIKQRVSKIAFYHIHPLFARAAELMLTLQLLKREEAIRILNTTNIARPSSGDIEVYLNYSDLYLGRGIEVVPKIADHKGILTYTIPESIRVSLVGPDRKKFLNSVAELNNKYDKLRIGFEEYKKEMTKLGVYINYRQIRDFQITERELPQMWRKWFRVK